ncbi:MAG: SurA N-terminal domain-containing protein [Nitrosomonas sp.]|nr:SurA N-terminal domain-containing protein [Nitrosomonas sp.]
MFDFVHKKKTIVQVVLFIAVLPFMFWGIQSYRGDGTEGYVAKVGSEEISRRDYEQALRNQQENLRNMLGDKFDSTLLDNPQMRLSVLENLIRQKLAQQEAASLGLTILETQLAAEIQAISFFQENGKFSLQRYQDLLQRQGMSASLFESRLANELKQQQLLEGITKSVIMPEAVTEKLFRLSDTKYNINRFALHSDQFVDQISPDETEILSYYDNHYRDFMLPEQLRVAYIVLSIDELAKQEEVTAEETKKYFSDHPDEFGRPEERRASHILLTASAEITEEARAEIRNKAEQLLQELQQNPERFEELAAEVSEDPGSAKMGGDLGFFGRGLMVKAFEDEVFSMQPKEIRGPIETLFGFHIIKLAEIKSADVASFNEVSDHIEALLKHQKASEKFGELAEDFRNIVFEENNTLQVAADMFNLPIQESDWISRQSTEPPLVTHQSVLDEIFSHNVIHSQSNTGVVEVQPDTLVAARALEHRPATAQSIELVRDQVISRLKLQLVQSLVSEKGQEILARLQAGKTDDELDWGGAAEISYTQAQGIDLETLRLVSQVDTSQVFPVYIGKPTQQGGYDLIRINQITESVGELADGKNKAFINQLQQLRSQEELDAYLSGLRQRSEVQIKEESF